MKCINCGNSDTKVIDTRIINEASEIKRRRSCEKCSFKFNTYEKIEKKSITVIKSDNTNELFDLEKLLKGVVYACIKRPVMINQIRELVKKVEESIEGNTIKSKQLGNLVISKLKDLDEVAYIRFASVYKDFKNTDEFIKEIEKIRGERL
ncbi:MAG: transcriptional regulator NrdR [Bacilli bacterium]